MTAWPGWLLSWRWLDRQAGLWSGIVRYRREGLVYEHAVAGDLIGEAAYGVQG